MKSITRLFGAVATLAASLEGLAALVDTTSGKLRQSLAVEGLEPLAQLPAPGDTPEPADGTPRRKARAAS